MVRDTRSKIAGLGGVWLAFGCGASQGAGFGPASSSANVPGADDAGDASSIGDESAFVSDSARLVFSNDAAAPSGVKFDCLPGTYSGMFSAHVTTDAGLLPALFSFNVTGTLSITLVGHVTQVPGTSESFAQPILTIEPGAKLVGNDATFGGHFLADVSGQLDCPSKTFNGTLSNGTYEYFGDSGSIMMNGSLSAIYDGTSTPPALTMGSMQLSSPQLTGVGSTGPWSATLH
jgi:hypothetical protein